MNRKKKEETQVRKAGDPNGGPGQMVERTAKTKLGGKKQKKNPVGNSKPEKKTEKQETRMRKRKNEKGKKRQNRR